MLNVNKPLSKEETAKYLSVNEARKWRWDVLSDIIIENRCHVLAELGFSQGENVRHILKNLSHVRHRIDAFYLIDIPREEQIKFYGSVSQADKYTHNMVGLELCKYYDNGSVGASQIVQDNTLDFIHMDGDTSCYESVKRDVLLWLPKLKSGGIMTSRHFYGTPGEEFCSTAHMKVVVEEVIGVENVRLYALGEMNSGKRDYIWGYKKP